MFNIFLINLFFINKDLGIANHADANTSYVTANKMDEVKSLEETSTKLFKWFGDNLMKSNADKCHFPADISCFPRRLQDVFRVTVFCLQDVLKTRLQNVFQKLLEDVFSTPTPRRMFARLMQISKSSSMFPAI